MNSCVMGKYKLLELKKNVKYMKLYFIKQIETIRCSWIGKFNVVDTAVAVPGYMGDASSRTCYGY